MIGFRRRINGNPPANGILSRQPFFLEDYNSFEQSPSLTSTPNGRVNKFIKSGFLSQQPSSSIVLNFENVTYSYKTTELVDGQDNGGSEEFMDTSHQDVKSEEVENHKRLIKPSTSNVKNQKILKKNQGTTEEIIKKETGKVGKSDVKKTSKKSSPDSKSNTKASKIPMLSKNAKTNKKVISKSQAKVWRLKNEKNISPESAKKLFTEEEEQKLIESLNTSGCEEVTKEQNNPVSGNGSLILNKSGLGQHEVETLKELCTDMKKHGNDSVQTLIDSWLVQKSGDNNKEGKIMQTQEEEMKTRGLDGMERKIKRSGSLNPECLRTGSEENMEECKKKHQRGVKMQRKVKHKDKKDDTLSESVRKGKKYREIITEVKTEPGRTLRSRKAVDSTNKSKEVVLNISSKSDSGYLESNNTIPVKTVTSTELSDNLSKSKTSAKQKRANSSQFNKSKKFKKNSEVTKLETVVEVSGETKLELTDSADIRSEEKNVTNVREVVGGVNIETEKFSNEEIVKSCGTNTGLTDFAEQQTQEMKSKNEEHTALFQPLEFTPHSSNGYSTAIWLNTAHIKLGIVKIDVGGVVSGKTCKNSEFTGVISQGCVSFNTKGTNIVLGQDQHFSIPQHTDWLMKNNSKNQAVVYYSSIKI